MQGPKDVAARHTPYLGPRADLDDQVCEWDREPVRNIPKLQARIGMHVERAAEGTAERAAG